MFDKQTLRNFLIELGKKNIPIGDDDSLIGSRWLDSLKIAELVVFLEKQYQLTLDADDLTPDNLDSINAIAAFLERKGVS